MFPPSPPQSSSIQYHGTMMEAFTNAKHEQISKWLELAMQAARHSTLVAGLLTSVNSSTLIARLVEANAPSTLAQYLSKWAQWSSFSTCTGGSCYEPSVASLADFLVVHSRGKLGSAISWVKALRFVANRLELKILQESLRSEIVRAFCKNVNAVERRETAIAFGVEWFWSAYGLVFAGPTRSGYFEVHAVGCICSGVSHSTLDQPRSSKRLRVDFARYVLRFGELDLLYPTFRYADRTIRHASFVLPRRLEENRLRSDQVACLLARDFLTRGRYIGAMAGLDLKVDDREAFQQLLDRWAAPEPVRRRLDQAGFNTVALLAHALPSLDVLEAFIESLLGRPEGSDPTDDLVVDVPRHLPLESVLRRYLDRLSVALSLLDACHLLTLKKMSEKFISLATAVPLDRSLRGPTLAEAMDADRLLTCDRTCTMRLRRDLVPVLSLRETPDLDGFSSGGSAHCDVLNSHVIPVTSFRGGDLRVECSRGSDVILRDGVQVPAVRLPVSQGPAAFSASQCVHEVLPFQGRRLVVAAYTLKACSRLSSDHSLQLSQLGFRLPSQADLDRATIFAPRMLCLSEAQAACLPSFAGELPAEAPASDISAEVAGPCLADQVDCLPENDVPKNLFHGKFFLDLCSGAEAPVTKALRALQADCFEPLDIIHGAQCDLLNDDCFDRLLELSASGLIGAALAAPPCGDFSLLKMRSGGPAPVRTPQEPDGCAANSWSQALRAQNSALLHDRCQDLLSRIAAAGGCIIFEQPPSSMTFLNVRVQQWLRSTTPYVIQVAACKHDLDVSKHWMFSSNCPGILELASSCSHSPGTHRPIWGQRAADGSFFSRLTAQYPKSLAEVLAAFLIGFTTRENRLLPSVDWRSALPNNPTWPRPRSRVEDGAGVHSSAFWIQPQSKDHLRLLRQSWTTRLCQDRLCLRIADSLRQGIDQPPVSQRELQPFLDDVCDFCGVLPQNRQDFLAIEPGQPFRLNVLEHLLRACDDSEADLCPMLREGVRLGVEFDIPPSKHWPLRSEEPELADLVICDGAWRSASDNPSQVRELLAAELQEGWIEEYSSLADIQSAFSSVAVGKLGLVVAEGRSPRLVVDSSISGVTAASRMPNRIQNPRIADVEACAPSCLGKEPWLAVALDVRKAHRLLKVARCDQALLAFSFEGRFFISKTLNFGARASAFWWARVAGSLLRLSHKIVWVSHLLWGYVDDFLGGFRGSTAPISASLWVLLFLVLGVPLSWQKAAWGPVTVWIGWEIDLRSWSCELPPAKISKILDQLEELISAGSKVRFKTLESLVGRLLWVTGLWKVLRPLLSPLYRALHALPSSCVGVSPELWNSILRNVDSFCVLARKTAHPSFHAGARITRVANSFVTSKDELLATPFRKRRLWVEVRDPDHPLRLAEADTLASLHAWKDLLISTPFVKSLRSPVDLQIVAEADACATETSMGLGGYVCWPSGRSHWFALSLSATELQDFSDLFPVPLQSHIAALELLAQLLLLWCIHQALPSCRGRLHAFLRCDNSAAEAASSKGMSSVLAMSGVLQRFLSFQAWSGIEVEVEHIAGYKNALADELSRLPADSVPPLGITDRVSPPLHWLLSSGLYLEPPAARWPEHLQQLASKK
ncbi:unnamed protein product [Symbiodinium microadriaticum]|nr:unnamed protein product [Symbiodinium microadriaticum]